MFKRQAMRIGELAAAVGLNPKTIRYYEAIGLLPTPQRTEAGYRLYGENDRERLQFIRKAAAVGLSLQEIGELLGVREVGERPCRHLGELVEQKLVAVDDQIAALQAFREELVEVRDEAKSERCEDGEVCGVIEHHRPLREDLAIPAEVHEGSRPAVGAAEHTRVTLGQHPGGALTFQPTGRCNFEVPQPKDSRRHG